MTMSVHDHPHEQDHDPVHDHDHGQAHDRGQEHGRHEYDEASAPAGGVDAQESPADTSRLYRAAVSHRADVVGTAGMGVLQRSVGNSAVGAMVQRSRDREAGGPETEAEQAGADRRSPVHDVISSGGAPLDTDTRADLEGRMGADFSDVRVHTDSAAHESAKGVGAHAYTVGNNVVFQRDAYDPSSPQGRTTLAHELTHVVQQRNGPVEGTEAPGGIRVSDPSDRYEREAVANADRVLSEPAPAAGPAPAAAAPAAASVPAVQRAESEDEDEQPADVQGSFVQRAEAEGAGEEKEKEEEESPSA
ncbi:DUF4157 domain-containing protein [Streptomyces sp. NBC_01267]|uniref:eCIS core domain-containing protein n=1 Tax=Streptomyces sp. NBC_01267 TaxID=2903805 RepID=UPI002E32866D|nr:DUF4157 domain-containing protein [Streptomyces sp. NBC_01267]